ncbi:hypothetical protein ACFLSK_00560 [Chloroflexota bacterium]
MTGLYLVCGFSRCGFMHSPAVGGLMADLTLEKQLLFRALSRLALIDLAIRLNRMTFAAL